MNLRWLVGLLLFVFAFAVQAEDNVPLSRDELSRLLRAGTTVLERLVTLEVEYGGTQTDQDGRAHVLWMSRDDLTLYLCFLPEESRTPVPGEKRTITGRVVRVELQEQDLRDHRIYALWLE